MLLVNGVNGVSVAQQLLDRGAGLHLLWRDLGCLSPGLEGPLSPVFKLLSTAWVARQLTAALAAATAMGLPPLPAELWQLIADSYLHVFIPGLAMAGGDDDGEEDE